MSAAEGLLRRCRDALAPEPVRFIVDPKGEWHFAVEPPVVALIDVQSLPHHPWLRIDLKNATVTIALDGKSVIYRRCANSFNRSEWICDLESQ